MKEKISGLILKTEGASKLLYKLMLVIFLLLVASGPLFAVVGSTELLSLFNCGVILAVAIFLNAKKLEVNIRPSVLLIFLSLLCFGVKFLWVFFVRIEPAVDYATYFEYAEKLSENFLCPDRYIALFPHIFGYSWFLSFFIKIFGTGELLVPIINVVLSVISGVFIFKIAHKLVDIRAALTAYLMWIFCPSQTIYNSLVLADLFYTTMMLAFIFLITEFEVSFSFKKTVLFGFFGGLVLRLVNITRPIAVIFVIAVVIWLFVLKTKEWSLPDFRKKQSVFLLVLVACYFITGPLWNIYAEKRIGEKPAESAGYSVMVGFNMGAMGMWNYEDSARLFEYSNMPDASANWAQEQMMNDAIERITSGEIDFIPLLCSKLKNFSGTDDSAIYYVSSVLPNSNREYSNLSNIFYYILICLSLFSLPSLCKNFRKSTMAVVLLYVIGLILAQMLVEVAGRYHYSMIPMLILVSQCGLFYKNKSEKTEN